MRPTQVPPASRPPLRLAPATTDRSPSPAQRRRPRGRLIFVDESGRRRRLMVVVGTAVGTMLLAALGLLVAGLTGTSPVRVPGFPDGGQPAGQFDPAGGAVFPQEPGDGETAGQPAAPPAPGATTESPNRRVPTHTPSHRPKPDKT